MPSLLVTVFTWAMGRFATRLFLALGIGVASYGVLKTSLDAALNAAVGALMDLPADVLQLLLLLGLSDFLSVIGSAMLTMAAINAARVYIAKL